VTARYQLTLPLRPQRWATYKITLVLLALSGLAVLCLVFLAAFWAATESDAVAQERQRRLVHERLQDQMDRAAHEIQLMSVGFSTFLNRRTSLATPVDPARATWSAATFGQIATSVFGYDAAFVVDTEGELLVPWDPESVKRYRWVKPLLMPLLGRSRDTPVPELTSERKSTAKVGLMKLEGRPSIAGAMPLLILPNPANSGSAERTSFHLIAFRFLDGAALDALSKEQGLARARYSRTSDQDAHEIAFQINATETRDPIGFIIWAPELPGSQVVGRLVPVLSGAGLLIAALFLALMARLRSSLRKLSNSEETARHLALHDPLTDLPNRALFADQLEQSCQDLLSNEAGPLLALLDLDYFKDVNDTFGHAVGDELLKAAVARMKSLTGENHLLARLGGDEFAILFNSPASPNEAFSLCARIVEDVGRPYRLCGDSITARIGCSAGLVMVNDANLTGSEWLRRADVALYVAKTRGKNRAVLYDRAFDEGTIERENVKADLRRLLADEAFRLPLDATVQVQAIDEFELAYQSIHQGNSEQDLSGAEALLRWRHPRRGLLSPDLFLPLVEELGFMDRLGRWVLASAVRAAANWPSTMSISVNVSPSQLKDPLFADDVLAILKAFRFDPTRLELEVTEAALFKADDVAKKSLSRLHAKGVSIALDDFGTGYSSLSHLLQFNIDRIKIDRSFVQLLGTKAEGAAIVSAVLSLSKSLRTSTTAEGVETDGQCDFLVAAGCSNLQGYLFSRPMAEQDFVSFINRHRQLKFASRA
jgi:diguanylate cyclase (GGDEF)-like protein